MDMNHVDEYNSIKHGFRIRSGGFALAVGLGMNVELLHHRKKCNLLEDLSLVQHSLESNLSVKERVTEVFDHQELH